MATKPTLLNKYESDWIGDLSQSKALMTAVAIQTGDVIAIIAATEGNATLGLTENGSATPVAQYLNVGNARIAVWTYVAAGNESLTVSVTLSSDQDHFGGCAYHLRGSDGVGDWSATSGTQVANTTIGTFNAMTGYPGDGANYGVFGGYYDDVGSAGNKTIGQTTPDGLDWTIAGVEIKGTAAGGGAVIPVFMHHYMHTMGR